MIAVVCWIIFISAVNQIGIKHPHPAYSKNWSDNNSEKMDFDLMSFLLTQFDLSYKYYQPRV